MLTIVVPATKCFNEETCEFISTKAQTLQLEHSLVSLSKWEAKWHTPFLSKGPHTHDETTDYIRCMTITQNVDPTIYSAISDDIVEKVTAYIEDPMTATKITDRDKKRTNNITTSENIYQWMVALQIPFECEKWHLNRLLTLIRVCNIKNAPADKKMSKRDIIRENRAINEARKQKFNTKG